MSMTLQVSPDIKKATRIKCRVNQRLVEWEESKFEILGSSTVIYAQVQIGRKRGSV